ncbi:MAG: TPM domain-containing protein [Verrucomicrobiota bacterium]
MIRLKHWWAIWLCVGSLAAQAHAQALSESTEHSPAPPAFGVLDQSGFFNRNPGALKRISEQIRKLEQKHGYRLFLVLEPVLIATSAPERASELRQAWVPDGNGLVVVFESDSRNLGIGRDMTSDQSRTANASRVPSYETTSILTRAMEAVDSKLSSDLDIESFMIQLTSGFEAYFKRRETPPPAERSMKIGLLVVGTLSLLGLGAIGVGGLVRHSGMAGVRRFRFPVVDRPERLGAPCGGNVTSRRFAPPAPRS